MAEDFARPPRLMSFVSEEQLDEAKKTRGERVEDGTAQRDRPLFEILKQNKDQKDAEFNERFKHRPPKALDDDETEFLDNLETTRKEYEQKIADEEARELLSFQAAVAEKSSVVQDLKETPTVPIVQKSSAKKNPRPQLLGTVVKVKPQAKKARIDQGGIQGHKNTTKTALAVTEKSSEVIKRPNGDTGKSSVVAKTGLVSYSDESEDD